MSAPQFTPGPWVVHTRLYGNRLTEVLWKHGRICQMGASTLQRENANLIAAAPELYEEAEFLCARLRELECDILDDEVGRQYYGHCSPARVRLEAALAKARGDQ